MKNWKRVATYPLIDNAKLQKWTNQLGHNAFTWFLFPAGNLLLLFLSSSCVWQENLTQDDLVFSVVRGDIVLIAYTAIAYYHYLTKLGYRLYFYIVFLVPTSVGLLASMSCVIRYLL